MPEIDTVAIFRPADHRETRSVEFLEEMGFTVVSDPLLEPRATGEKPLFGADYIIFTSITGVEIVFDEDDNEVLGANSTVCAIGPKTRDALEARGVEVGIVPDDFTSEGLVEALRGKVRGKKVEVARSDHGTPTLIDGLNDAGGFVHETVLYELVKPEKGGDKTVRGVLEGEIDAVLFTSSLTVENLVDSAGKRREELIRSLNQVFVGTIGSPTRETAESLGIEVDYVPEDATFEELAQGLVR